MARHLLDAGFPLAVHSRRWVRRSWPPRAPARARARPRWRGSTSPSRCCRIRRTSSSCCSARAAGPKGPGGSLAIDMSTIDPLACRRIAEGSRGRGRYGRRASVSGGEKGAHRGHARSWSGAVTRTSSVRCPCSGARARSCTSARQAPARSRRPATNWSSPRRSAVAGGRSRWPSVRTSTRARSGGPPRGFAVAHPRGPRATDHRPVLRARLPVVAASEGCK